MLNLELTEEGPNTIARRPSPTFRWPFLRELGRVRNAPAPAGALFFGHKLFRVSDISSIEGSFDPTCCVPALASYSSEITASDRKFKPPEAHEKPFRSMSSGFCQGSVVKSPWAGVVANFRMP